jgi:ABC-type transport system substrate-binding protein
MSYWSLVNRRRLSRRRLMAVTGSAAAGAALLAACGGDDKEAKPGSAVERLVLGVEYTGEETKDFMIGGGGAQSWLFRPHMETLLAKGLDSNKETGRLAQDWRLSPDGTSVTFKLKPGVQFQDGWGEVTAEEVAWNYDVHKRIQKSSTANRSIKRIEVLGPHELTVHLARPDYTVTDQVFTDQYSTSGIVSKKHWESVGDPKGLNGPVLASAGPWKLTEWAAGDHILFERTEKHWRQTPAFKQLEYRIINENSTRLSALLAGEIGATTLPWDLHKTAVGRGMKVLTGKVPAFHVWMEFFGAGARDPATGKFRHPNSPLVDIRVRKALNKAIDREAMNKAFLGGEAEVMLLNHMHPTREGWDASWERRWKDEYGYDPAAARTLLSAAGYTTANPLRTTMLKSYQTGFPEGPDVQETIISYWKAVGVDCKLETVDRAAERRISESFGYDNHFWMGTTFSATGLDGYRIRQINDPETLASDPSYKGNFRGINLPELEDVIIKTISARNAEEFERQSKQMGELAYVNHVTVPLYWLPSKIVVDPKLIKTWQFSGALVGLWGQTEYIEPAKA